MRKTLLALATIVVLAGLFAGSWFVTGMLSGENDPAATSSSESFPAEGVEGSNEATTSTIAEVDGGDPAQISLPQPRNLVELTISLGNILRTFGANDLAITRMVTYASVAYFDTFNPKGSRSFIASEPGDQGDEQGMLAASAVVSRLLANPVVTQLVDSWDGELTAESEKVVEAVVGFAQNDGYDSIAGVKAPTYEGEIAWKPGGTRHGTPDGYEPGYGTVRTILVDTGACPVDAVPLDTMAAERKALSSVDMTVPAPVVAGPERFANIAYTYMRAVANSESGLLTTPQSGQIGLVMLHDALVATWKANWANGVAAPGDLFADGNPQLLSSLPSYPSWTEVAVAATERYLAVITGKTDTFEEIVAIAIESAGDNQYADQLKAVLEDTRNARSATHHWASDIEAGRKLGTCIADEALKALARQ